MPVDRSAAERLVRNGDVPVAVILPKGLGAGFEQMGFASSGPAVELLADPSDPVAPQMVQGLLQKVTMTAAPDLMMQGGMKQFEKYAGALTPATKGGRRVASDAEGQLQRRCGTSPQHPMGVAVQVVDVMRTDDRKGSLISFYAAGIGVMFLLFSGVGAAGGALLEEAESGTLERLLSTNINMTKLLLGKWLFLSPHRDGAAHGDVPVGPRGLRTASLLTSAWFLRHDRGYWCSRGRVRHGARHAGP